MSSKKTPLKNQAVTLNNIMDTTAQKQMRIAVFGGSFNPVHFGHMGIVSGLVKQRYDKVIVMPAFVSPFKDTETAVDFEQRDEMLRLAFMSFLFDISVNAVAVAEFIRTDRLIISDIETKRKGVSFTYETVNSLKEQYPDAAFDFVIGEDCLPSLKNWKNFDKLKKMTDFLIVKRGHSKNYDVLLEELKAAGANLRIAGFDTPDISSSFVRILNAFGRASEAVPQSVADYIKENKLYREYRYIAKRYAESGISKERAEHSIRVAEDAINLAKINGVNLNDAITAALLHDIAKNTSWAEMSESGYLSAEDTEKIENLPEACRHAWIGAWAVEKLMGLSPEIADAVRLHTTGAPDMSALAKIIYLADYIEKGRSQKDLTALRKTVYADLDEGMRTALKLTLGHLEQRGGEICDLTREAHKFYLKNKA